MNKKMIAEYVGRQIKKHRLLNDMTQKDLGEKVGVKHNTISLYENGTNEPDSDTIFRIAKILNVSIDALFPPLIDADNADKPIMKIKKVPMLGEIAAGEPILAEENCEYYVEIDNTIQIDFCLRVKGDSMIEARIHPGDIVFVKKQSVVENGEIAVVLIDNEATLKRFYKNDGGVILKPENKKYQPKYFSEKDFKAVRILGKAVFFQGEVS
jgi:repressor LexA